jgi:hypothetical protein
MDKILKKIIKALIIAIAYIPIRVYVRILKIRIGKHVLERVMKFTIAEEGTEREFEIYDRIKNMVADKLDEGIFMSFEEIDKLTDRVINNEFYGTEL